MLHVDEEMHSVVEPNHLFPHCVLIFPIFLLNSFIYLLTNIFLYYNIVASFVLGTGDKKFHLSENLHFFKTYKQISGPDDKILGGFVGGTIQGIL